MELVEVEITGQAITARYGTLNTGDILRTDAAFAKHLVEDCNAAKYKTSPVAKIAANKPAIGKKREKAVLHQTPAADPENNDSPKLAGLALNSDAAHEAVANGQVGASKDAVADTLPLDQNKE